MDSEKRERQFQNKLMCGQISVHQNVLYFYDKTTNVESIKETPVVSIDDLPTFPHTLTCVPQTQVRLVRLKISVLPSLIKKSTFPKFRFATLCDTRVYACGPSAGLLTKVVCIHN